MKKFFDNFYLTASSFLTIFVEWKKAIKFMWIVNIIPYFK